MRLATAAFALLAALALGATRGAADEPLNADLSDHIVAITTGFTGLA